MNTLINGAPCDTISVNDRGLLYGDGVFRTLLLKNGKVLQWHRHYQRLFKDCTTLKLTCPPESLLHTELENLVAGSQQGVIKVIITRGLSQRGYVPSHNPVTTRILSLTDLPSYPPSNYDLGVNVHICQIRLGSQPRLAGVKHLNRLENVLASAEWSDPAIAEGLLLDELDNVIEGVRSNIFMVKDGELLTPDLSRCGVSGVQRERLIEWAAQQGVNCKIKDIQLAELFEADEIFLVNSVIGLWPVHKIGEQYSCDNHPVAKVIQDWLLNENN
ncbi:MAG: aminodeoxychorismate lyase [Gallionellaceae bacterium]